MDPLPPQATVVQKPTAWGQITTPMDWPWHEIQPLPPLQHADDSGPAADQTEVRLCHADGTLYVHFICHDRDIWGTYTQRDDPIYDEEVAEVFLAPGLADPVEYAELEISPNGVLLDAWIVNPTSERENLTADFGWDCPGLGWWAWSEEKQDRWWALFAIPLWALLAGREMPSTWRANFYRIERPRDRGDGCMGEEYSCWSPTNTSPADFHKPAQFGRIDLA